MRLEPVERCGLQLMSVGFLLGERQALPFTAPSLAIALRQFVGGTDWGELEFLVIDLPPGTADLQHEVTRALELSGALIVVGPQDAAHLDAKRVVELFESAGVRILGGVENMSELECPHYGGHVDVFPLPLDPATTQNGRGPVMVADHDSPQARRFVALARAVRDALYEEPS